MTINFRTLNVGYPGASNMSPWGNGLQRARSSTPRGLREVDTLGTDETANGDDFNWSQVPNWIKDIQLAVNTQKLLNLNIQRAAAGLPPITSQAVAPTVNFGVSADTQKMLLYGAIALGAVFLISRRKR